MVVASGEINTADGDADKPTGWVKIYDVETGREQSRSRPMVKTAFWASFSPDGASVMAVLGSIHPD